MRYKLFVVWEKKLYQISGPRRSHELFHPGKCAMPGWVYCAPHNFYYVDTQRDSVKEILRDTAMHKKMGYYEFAAIWADNTQRIVCIPETHPAFNFDIMAYYTDDRYGNKKLCKLGERRGGFPRALRIDKTVIPLKDAI